MKSPKIKLIPLQATPICGHPINVMQCVGREEETISIEIKGITYIGRIETGSCLICNQVAEKLLKKTAQKMSKGEAKC